MRDRSAQFLALLVLSTFLMTGCATASFRARRAEAAKATSVDPQVTALQSELQAKDQQIQDLQYQLEQSRQNPQANFTASSKGKSSKIRVSGVSVSDVQSALTKAGFDPGKVDGKMGKKTKAAIKAFQRSQNLTPDGVVGEKTWKTLQG